MVDAGSQNIRSPGEHFAKFIDYQRCWISVVRADRKVGGRADAEAPRPVAQTNAHLIQDKLTGTAIDRVKGGRQSPGPTSVTCSASFDIAIP